jgi:hypothetical protein
MQVLTLQKNIDRCCNEDRFEKVAELYNALVWVSLPHLWLFKVIVDSKLRNICNVNVVALPWIMNITVFTLFDKMHYLVVVLDRDTRMLQCSRHSVELRYVFGL